MPLDRHAKRILDMMAAAAGPARTPPDLQEFRSGMERLAGLADIRDVRVGDIENRSIPGSAGPVAVRIYSPLHSESGPSAGLLYFHGGAGIGGSLDTHEGLCRILSNASACRVIAVDYRLAPAHPFPAALEDAYEAICWVADHVQDLDLDASRLGVAGDSHGGTLAAAICQQARARGGPSIALQLLLCPVLDLGATTASREAFATGYFLEAPLLRWAIGQYCPPGVDLRDPRVSPLHEPDLNKLPTAQIHTAEFDPMRDEGAAYAQALRRAGVEVSYICHPGMIHHFYAMAGAIPYARLALESAGAAARQALGRL